jgi:lipid-A-disaccharide synthase
MIPKRIMVIAGEISGDMLAAELVGELREALRRRSTYSTDLQPLQADLAPRFFGAGGPRLADEGVELAFDLTRFSVIGLSDALKNYLRLLRLASRLFDLAIERQPHAIICVDFSGFNRRFAAAVRKHIRKRRATFNNWNPKIVQYVSPQVWASRESRVYQVARDYDLLLSIFPFEKKWYAERVPNLKVEFVGHPMIDRHGAQNGAVSGGTAHRSGEPPSLLVLPGSRPGELRRHLPVMSEALNIVQAMRPEVRTSMVLPTEALVQQAKTYSLPPGLRVCCGGLSEALAAADLAIASTGTVTMECAYFGVPAVTLYKTSWSTYEVARRIVKVDWLSMPNLLAGEAIYPEFLQHDATPENIARAALDLLGDEGRRQRVRARLAEIITALGGHGATRRAAEEIARLLA